MHQKKSHKTLKVILMIICILIVAALALAFWQRENITAVIEGYKTSDEDIQQQISDSKKDIESELEEYNIQGLRDFTFEEEEAIRKGQMTAEEAVAKIIAESGQSGSSENGTAQDTSNSKSDSGAVISEYTVKLYTLKATYLGQIGNLIDQAKAEYKNGTSASSLMSNYLGKAASLESEADSKVDALLSELKGKLDSVGADTSIVNKMRSSYENEKQLKKAYYVSLFNKKK